MRPNSGCRHGEIAVDLKGTEAEVEVIMAGANERLHVVGQITYEDIYKVEHLTNFCFMYVQTQGKRRFVFCDRLNEAD